MTKPSDEAVEAAARSVVGPNTLLTDDAYAEVIAHEARRLRPLIAAAYAIDLPIITIAVVNEAKQAIIDALSEYATKCDPANMLMAQAMANAVYAIDQRFGGGER